MARTFEKVRAELRPSRSDPITATAPWPRYEKDRAVFQNGANPLRTMIHRIICEIYADRIDSPLHLVPPPPLHVAQHRVVLHGAEPAVVDLLPLGGLGEPLPEGGGSMSSQYASFTYFGRSRSVFGWA